jgi:hypothetical protein
MKATITLENGKTYDTEISKDLNHLIIKFNNSEFVPFQVIRQGKFGLQIKPTEEEIGCCSDCNVCMTPIC